MKDLETHGEVHPNNQLETFSHLNILMHELGEDLSLPDEAYPDEKDNIVVEKDAINPVSSMICPDNINIEDVTQE